MSAAFPNQIKSFSTKQDFIDTVDAADPNTIQDEVVAIETAIGTTPAVSTTPSPAGTFNATSTNFGSIAARLANIETGIVSDTHVHYVHLRGGDTIVSSAIGVVGLTYRAITGQTANFVNFRDVNNVLLGYVSAAGNASFQNVSVPGTVTARPGGIIGAAVPIPFHVSGILTTGIKVPKFIAPCNMTIRGGFAVCDSGGGATYQVRINGSLPTAMAASPAVGTTVAYYDFADVAISAGDRVQIEVVNAGSSANDLSVTLDAVTT